MTYFDQDGRPTAVDTTLPVDLMEPLEESPDRDLPPLITVVDFVARTFLTGDPRITHIAWRIVLGDEWEALRACARRSGCTAQAISRRVGILSRLQKRKVPEDHARKLARWEQREEFRDRLNGKRREDRNPPAASDDQSKTNTHAKLKGGRP
jgi:hypothetical protein